MIKKEATPRSPLFQKALSICEHAHAGQFRRDGVTPYAKHPKAVAEMLVREDECVQVAALLHDVLEDTEVTTRDLLNKGIPEDIVIAVELVTKQPGDDYDSFIDRIMKSNNYIAQLVKIADILSNLQDNPTSKQVEKYSKALERLVFNNV